MPDGNITRVIIAEVIAVIPEFHQTVCTAGVWQYAITRKAEGLPWDALKEGDMIEIEVFTQIPIVKKVLNVIKS